MPVIPCDSAAFAPMLSHATGDVKRACFLTVCFPNSSTLQGTDTQHGIAPLEAAFELCTECFIYIGVFIL
jgi:hypothetical protein